MDVSLSYSESSEISDYEDTDSILDSNQKLSIQIHKHNRRSIKQCSYNDGSLNDMKQLGLYGIPSIDQMVGHNTFKKPPGLRNQYQIRQNNMEQ